MLVLAVRIALSLSLVLCVHAISLHTAPTFHPRGLFGLEARTKLWRFKAARYSATRDNSFLLESQMASGSSNVTETVSNYGEGQAQTAEGKKGNATEDQQGATFKSTDRASSKRTFSISMEDLSGLLSDPMGLFLKRQNSKQPHVISLEGLGNRFSSSNASAEQQLRPMLTIAEREALVRKWGVAFELAESEAVSIFERLRTSATGMLSKKEFMAALRLLGVEKPKTRSSTIFRGKHSYNRLLEFMFNAIDLDNVGAVSCFSFLDWLLTMTSGNPEARLRWGFNVCDTNCDGYANKAEVTALLTSMFSVLTGLRLDHMNPYVDIFVCSLFQNSRQDTSKKDAPKEGGSQPEPDQRSDQLSWEEYKRGCLGSADVMALVHSSDQAYRKGYFGGSKKLSGQKKVLQSGGLALRLGKAVFMSQRKCDFILTLMLGLQVAVEPPVQRAATPPLQVEHDDEPRNILEVARDFVFGALSTLLRGRDQDEEGDEDQHLTSHDVEPLSPRSSSRTVNQSWIPQSDDPTLPSKISVETYKLPGVLRWASYDEEVQGWGCIPGCLSASPEEQPSAITAYGADMYRQIRQAFGVSDDLFLASLGIKQVIGGLLMGDMRGMAEQVSEGRSGSLFYFSHDGNFMVKTVSSSESEAMQDMLPEYCSYILQNPHTLLMRILGHFDLLHCGKTHHLVVLANVFNTSLPIHERFDLKGSSFGRTLGPKRGVPGLVNRDLDFTETGRQIRVRSSLASSLCAQIHADAAFLHRQNVVDYSLLIGVHRRNKASGARRDQPLFPSQERNGQEAVQGQTWVAQNSKSLQTLFDSLRSTLESQRQQGAVGEGFLDRLAFDTFAQFAHASSSSSSAESPKHQPEKQPEKQAKNSRKQPKYQQAGGGGAAGTGSSQFQQVWGGMYGSTRAEAAEREEEVIFVGIIDTLVPFKMKKRAEYWIKSILQRGKNFSVIPPKDYARRFADFCTSIVHSFPDAA